MHIISDVEYLNSLLNNHFPGLMEEITAKQSAIPDLAKNPELLSQIRSFIPEVETRHYTFVGDARDLSFIDKESVHLALTSPPYWTLKKYNDHQDQLGDFDDYDEFIEALTKVWEHVFRVLVPGGRLIVVVGDVCLSRRRFGRHVVVPLHSTIQESCRKLGFDNLAPIIWQKIANASYEAGGGGFYGKPYEPNGIIKNDIEYILFFRKPGGYRRPTTAMRAFSTISENEHREWFQQIWSLPGASTKLHPAPFPVSLAERLVQMYSFVGDYVLDPFLGTGSTMIAAAMHGRNSIGVDIDEEYALMAYNNLIAAALPSTASIYNIENVQEKVNG